MKIKAYILKDTGAALLLANKRADFETSVTTAWVPRSIIDHLKKFGPKPGQEDAPPRAEVTVPDWFVRKTPDLELFAEI